MDYKKLFIGISITSTVYFFSSIMRTGKYSAQTPSHLSDSHESVVKGKYKSLFYKLWQYATKNKPSSYNGGVIYYENKRPPQVQWLFTSYKCFLKRFLHLKNCIKQVPSLKSQRSFLLKSSAFFHKSNNIGWRNVSYFIPHIDLIGWILAYIRHLLRKEQFNNHKEYSKLNNPILQIYKIKRRQQKAPHRIGICIHKIFHNKVYC